MNDEKRLQNSRQYWDEIASSFDDAPDHGLHDPVILENWTAFLKTWLPSTLSSILDIGCGTGSLSVVLAGLGHQVTGIDLSPVMISLAQQKAAAQGFQIEFQVMDAAYPKFPPKQKFDVILCRHLLWALPEPKHVLQRWTEFLLQKGKLFLIEGYWGTGVGLHAQEIIDLLPPTCATFSYEKLSENPDFWGRKVNDERYAVIAAFGK